MSLSAYGRDGTSITHQNRMPCLSEDCPCCASENKVPQPRMPESSHDEQCAALLIAVFLENGCNRLALGIKLNKLR